MISNYRLLDGLDQKEIDEIIKIKIPINKVSPSELLQPSGTIFFAICH